MTPSRPDRQWATDLLDAIEDQDTGLARAIREGLACPEKYQVSLTFTHEERRVGNRHDETKEPTKMERYCLRCDERLVHSSDGDACADCLVQELNNDLVYVRTVPDFFKAANRATA